MDEKSLRILEFHRIREIISGFTCFSASRELANGLMPVSDYAVISLSLKQSTEAHRLLVLEPGFSIGGVTDIREKVRMAVLGRVLEPAELLEIRCTLEAIRKLRSSLTGLSEELPLLWAIAGDITALPGIEESINRCISPTAELLESASPALAAIRHRLKELREHLLNRLHSIINSPRGQMMVQE
ncbi:MAG: hypothetical protein PHQ43_03340, partial [Dehalococcoidales bacterium]|nr:hypothetical protein [Dehalococcoidales bacterium]